MKNGIHFERLTSPVPHTRAWELQKARRALADDYVPSEDEEYMGPAQQDYFRLLLLEWKRSILSAANATLQSLQDGPIREADLNDRAIRLFAEHHKANTWPGYESLTAEPTPLPGYYFYDNEDAMPEGWRPSEQEIVI